MKKVTKAVAAIMLITTMFCAAGCTKPDDSNNNGNDSPIETNLMDGSIEGIMDFNGLSIETMYDEFALNGKNFAVEIADSDIPQFIAVTDADTNCYMLYRGRLDKNVPVVIDANSTALALVTMHPVLGPIVDADEYSQLLGIIQSNSHFDALKQGVASAIAAKRPVSDTTNREIMDALYGFFEELTALAGLDSNGRPDISDFLESYPMQVVTNQNTLTMRVNGLSPSYYGTITTAHGQTENVRVLSRADYGGMDLFTHTVENAHWGEATNYEFRTPGVYNFDFSKNNPQALSDYYLHLANNIAGLLGVSLDNNTLNALADCIGQALLLYQGNTPGNVQASGMVLVGIVYQGVVNFLSNPQTNNGMWSNWQMAGGLLGRLLGVYNVIKNSSNALIRVAYFLQAPDDINFCLEYYSNSGINPCSETTLTIVGGNNQVGFEHETLPEPLEVYVSSQTDNGWYIHPDYVVRFSVISGDGELLQEDVEVDENHKASTHWTLGGQGEQKVSAVVVDPETGDELSNKVFFEATFNEGFVTTMPVTDITQTSAKCGGVIADDAMIYVTRCGVCWNTSGAPTIDDSQVFTGPGTGTFYCNMVGLTPYTTYHVRAFARMGEMYYYGNEEMFTTEEEDGDWVDLGLPSGQLWATRNVGASSPEDYGDYFAWGENSPKSMYNWDTYIYGYETDESPWYHLTKYNTVSDYGPIDNLTTLQPGDDAATANWGNGARMPTRQEWEELEDYCSSVWTTQNGVNGRRFTGPNGNSLFLPAAGYRWYDEPYDAGDDGNYWSSSLSTYYSPEHACHFHFKSFSAGVYNGGSRGYGRSVRAVRSSGQN